MPTPLELLLQKRKPQVDGAPTEKPRAAVADLASAAEEQPCPDNPVRLYGGIIGDGEAAEFEQEIQRICQAYAPTRP